ncbi:MAG: SpoIVB peptidase S55 [Terracidiphilus sp.]
MATSVLYSIRDSPAAPTASSFQRLQVPSGCNLIDVKSSLKQTAKRLVPVVFSLAFELVAVSAVLLSPVPLRAQSAVHTESGPPPSSGGVFPLSQVHRGLTGTAWTVFSGSKPEAMEVEILGVLRGARGPGQDLILAQLHGAKPEYTGVVEGMSGSPVYIGNKLLGALSYRIGQFSKEPIAGITPIEQMLEVRDLPGNNLTAAAAGQNSIPGGGEASLSSDIGSSAQPSAQPAPEMNFQMMETPLVMSGFRPEAINLWQKQMAGSSLAEVAAGGVGGASSEIAGIAPGQANPELSAAAEAAMEPGSAVSAQLIRGDEEISATCTVTYIDSKRLLACGHPILQAGPISLPMTTADVVATLASPLNAFKIINTGATIGTFTQDRGAAISGNLGARAHMIPMHIAIDSPEGKRAVNVEILDLPSLTPQAMEVTLYNALLQSNDSSADSSYHVTGNIDIEGHGASPINVWAVPNDAMPAPMQAALLAGDHFTRLYTNGARQGTVREIDVHVQTVPKRMQVELESARLVSSDIVHAGDTIQLEATIRPWQQPARNVRIPITLPARLGEGNLRLLVSDAGTLDRTLNQPQFSGRQPDLDSLLAQYTREHAADRIYVSLLVPETQAGVSGNTLTSLPLSVANALEPLRSAQAAGLNGESAVVAGDAPAGGVLYGFQVINLHIEAGGGLN